MLIARLALIFAALVLLVVVVKALVVLALVAALAAFALLAVRYARAFLRSALAASRRRPVTPLPRRNVRVVGS